MDDCSKQLDKSALDTVAYAKAELCHIGQIVGIERVCFPDPWSEKSFVEELHNSRAHYFVALFGQRVVGYCGYWEIVGEGHISNVAVHPDYRGMGIGASLIGRLIDHATRNGVGSFTLEVREDNGLAIKLYEKLGFRSVGMRKNYYREEGKHALIMWKR